MSARQWEASRAVIKRCRTPIDRRVAGLAHCREVTTNMIRVHSLLEVRLVASKTFSGQFREHVVLMARGTGCRLVSTEKREACQCMIETSPPGKRCHLMAL